MIRTIPWRGALVATAVAASGATYAQLPTGVDITLEHDAGNQQLLVKLRANDYSFDQLLSSCVFTVRWPDSSPATLGLGSSAWCPAPSVAFPVAPSSTQTPGTGYKYRTWTSVGLTLLGDLFDDGGCEQSLPADEWVTVYQIPISNDPGGTSFEIADDQWTSDNNRSYFISLAGISMTPPGVIITGPTAAGVPSPSVTPTLTLHPNPASDLVLAQFPSDKPTNLNGSITDTAGRIVLTLSNLKPGSPIDVSGLPSGAYHMTLSAVDRSLGAPLIIAR